MKDSFIFEGKKYISAKRASEISDYSSDYIGQLCRGEKLDCRMIGRSWFVTEESLHLHKANVLHDEIYRNRIQNLRGGKKSQKKNAASVESDSVATTHVDDSAPASVVQIPETVAAVTESEAVLPVVVSEPFPAVVEQPAVPMLVRGIEDEAPRTEATTAPIARPLQITRIHVNEEGEITTPVQIKASKETYPEIARTIILRRALQSVAVLIVVAGLSLGAFSMVGSNANVARGESANLFDTISSLSSFVGDHVRSVFAVFGHNRELSMNTPTTEQGNAQNIPVTTSDTDSSGASQAMAVVPSTGSAAGDEAIKQKIQDSFSDQVEVHPDESGTTGVIKPVFREAKGKDFVYVMVPLNPAPTPVSGTQDGVTPP